MFTRLPRPKPMVTMFCRVLAVTECGYKTKTEARKQWLQNTFGEVLGNAVMQLLESSNVKGEGTVSGPAVSGSLTADITGPP